MTAKRELSVALVLSECELMHLIKIYGERLAEFQADWDYIEMNVNRMSDIVSLVKTARK